MAVNGQVPDGFPRSKARARKRTPRQSATDRCDALFSRLVRRHDACEHCGSRHDLECAHGFPRTYSATRWDFRNAFCLCHGCHRFFTENPLGWDDWLVIHMGRELYLDLRLIAQTGKRPDLTRVWAQLREIEARAA